MLKTISIRPDVDETGSLEEFTWDLWPLVPADQTLHLDTHGLPKTGTVLHPGMVLIGKIGQTLRYTPERAPTALEKQGVDFETLRVKYGDMWKDGSLYVTPDTIGVIVAAYFVEDKLGTSAVVEIEN